MATEAKITISTTPAEFDTIRQELGALAIQLRAESRNATSDIRRDLLARAAKLEDILAKLR